ncbi:MAG: hypothetical protein ACJLTB_21825 [Algoriphagus aquaeductus]|uniref:hypothetical protein n=1 Tax=Algoriphagus aquaeductus TaxID=475299 RepID=UPI003879E420
MKNPFLLTLSIGIILITLGCQSKSPEELAQKDASTFFKNLDIADKLEKHPMVKVANLPEEIANRNKTKNIEKLQDYLAEICPVTKEFNLLKSYRKYSDDNKKILFLEYEFCKEGVLMMGYEVEDNNVTLFSVWPMRKEERPEVLFTDEQLW